MKPNKSKLLKIKFEIKNENKYNFFFILFLMAILYHIDFIVSSILDIIVKNIF